MSHKLIEVVRRIRNDGYAGAPASNAAIASGRNRAVPEPLLELYRHADGLFLVDGDDFPAPDGRRFRFRVPRLDEGLQTVAEHGFAAEDSPLFPRLKLWWQVLDCGDSNWVGMTEAADGFRLVDLFHETVGEPGSHMVIASSIAAVLEGLLEARGMFWLKRSFPGLGWI